MVWVLGLVFAVGMVCAQPRLGQGPAHAQTQPVPRAGPAMVTEAIAYDAARGQVVIFGGEVGPAPCPFGTRPSGCTHRGNETWTWDGRTWTQHFPSTSPPARSMSGMTYDADRQVVVLFGGYAREDTSPDGHELGDTWAWDGVTWTEQTPATSPVARGEPKAAYDAAHAQIVLFGGLSSPPSPGSGPSLPPLPVGLADTLTWDSTTWTEQQPPTSPPALVSGHGSMAFSTRAGKTFLIGPPATPTGVGAWTWDGTTWAPQALPDNLQQVRSSFPPSLGPQPDLLVVDAPGLGGLLLFTGPASQPFQQVWRWDGATWADVSQAVPAESSR